MKRAPRKNHSPSTPDTPLLTVHRLAVPMRLQLGETSSVVSTAATNSQIHDVGPTDLLVASTTFSIDWWELQLLLSGFDNSVFMTAM